MLDIKKDPTKAPREERVRGTPGNGNLPGPDPSVPARLTRQGVTKLSSEYTELKMSLHRRLLDMINLSVIDKMAPAAFRREIGEIVRELLM